MKTHFRVELMSYFRIFGNLQHAINFRDSVIDKDLDKGQSVSIIAYNDDASIVLETITKE